MVDVGSNIAKYTDTFQMDSTVRPNPNNRHCSSITCKFTVRWHYAAGEPCWEIYWTSMLLNACCIHHLTPFYRVVSRFFVFFYKET